MNRDVWNRLSQYQTHDLVRRAYRRKHDRDINAQRTWEITSCFIQGQEYFASASTAAESVKPLLLYYGVASISRGMILFLNRTAKEENLKPSHGLAAKNWAASFALPGVCILDLEVTVENGTFYDLLTTTEAIEQIIIPVADGGIIFAENMLQSELAIGDSIQLGAILARIPKLWLSFNDTLEKRPTMRLGSIVYTADCNIVRVVLDPVSGVKSADEVRSLYRVPPDVEIQKWLSSGELKLPHFAYQLPHAADGTFHEGCPHIERDHDNVMGQLIVPLSNGGDLSPLLKGYLVSYFMGMLVRYFPSRWMALLRNQKGDAVLPLLREAVAYVEDKFPKIALEAL